LAIGKRGDFDAGVDRLTTGDGHSRPSPTCSTASREQERELPSAEIDINNGPIRIGDAKQSLTQPADDASATIQDVLVIFTFT
jgi:hypothetical protein